MSIGFVPIEEGGNSYKTSSSIASTSTLPFKASTSTTSPLLTTTTTSGHASTAASSSSLNKNSNQQQQHRSIPTYFYNPTTPSHSPPPTTTTMYSNTSYSSIPLSPIIETSPQGHRHAHSLHSSTSSSLMLDSVPTTTSSSSSSSTNAAYGHRTTNSFSASSHLRSSSASNSFPTIAPSSSSSSSTSASGHRGGDPFDSTPSSSSPSIQTPWNLQFITTRLRSLRRNKLGFLGIGGGGGTVTDTPPLRRIVFVALTFGCVIWFLIATGAPPRTKKPTMSGGGKNGGFFGNAFPFLSSLSSTGSSSSHDIITHSSLPPPPSPEERLKVARTQFDEDPNLDGLAYRRFLERTTSPEGQMTHSPTMTFDHIYVLSLPHRKDRRAEMTRLANALGVRLTFVDAALKDEPFIQWIGERVAETRELRRRVMAKARKTTPESIGGLHIGSDWLTPYLDKKHAKVFPQFPSDRKRYPSGNWITHLEALHTAGNHTSLRPVDPNFDLAKALQDPLEEYTVRQVHEGIISTYWGQTRALKEVVTNGDRAALIMEDDVDVEWDLERLWSRIQIKLPEDWDVTFLGHCWSREYITPMRLHPHIHASVMPMCLHGWAVSADGAQRLLSTFLDPWSAYSSAVDLVLPTMIRYHRIAAYSIQPPLIIQRKDGPSDLQEGSGSKWRGILRDSTVERLAKNEGTYEGMKPFDPANIDPGTKLRMGWCPSEDDEDGKDGEGR